MEREKRRLWIISATVIAFAVITVLITLMYAINEKKEHPTQWVLQSYGNSVALYNGNEVVEVYSAIVLDTLPDEDKLLLDNGISFLTKEEAIMAIEDYDG